MALKIMPMAGCERRPSRDRDDRRPVGELLVAVGLPGPAHPAGQLRRHDEIALTPEPFNAHLGIDLAAAS